MIVQPETARAILAGRITQARRPTRWKRRHSYRVGTPLPPSDKPNEPKSKTACYIYVLETKKQSTLDATDADAVREGFNSADELREHWGERTLWVASIVLDRSQRTRLLAQTGSGADERGYTSSPSKAIEDAGEAVEDAYLQEFAKRGRENFNQTRRESLALALGEAE